VKEGEAGRKVADLCRVHGIAEQTCYRWKATYGGMELARSSRLSCGKPILEKPLPCCDLCGARYYGPEFAGRTLDAWAYAQGISLRFIRPRKPIENAYVESFNGKFGDECLNEQWFVNLVDAKDAIERWRVDYNTVRPHSSLNLATPEHFARFAEGPRRLPPARPDEKDGNQKPEVLTLSV
jgi:putative transposase